MGDDLCHSFLGRIFVFVERQILTSRPCADGHTPCFAAMNTVCGWYMTVPLLYFLRGYWDKVLTTTDHGVEARNGV